MTDAIYYHEPLSSGHYAPSTVLRVPGTEGKIVTATALEFAIKNTGGEGSDGYTVHFFSDSGDFTYTGSPPTPTGGTITKVTITNANGFTYIELTGPFHDDGLLNIWTELTISPPAEAGYNAMTQLVGSSFAVTGSADPDQAETYGDFGTFSLKGGNDTLDIWHNLTTAIGGAGNDVFKIHEASGLGPFELRFTAIHGGTANGSITPGEINTINLEVAGAIGFDKLDGVNRFKFSGNDPGQQTIVLTTNQLVGGSRPVFTVVGSTDNHANYIEIERGGTVAVNLDVSQVTVLNYARLNQGFQFKLDDDSATTPQNDYVWGVHSAQNNFDFDYGNDTAVGGSKLDTFFGGHGNDRFNGKGGIDYAFFTGARSDYTITDLGNHTYKVIDNRPGSPDGTDTLVNVERAGFSDGIIDLGPGSSDHIVHTVGHAHHVADA